MYKTVRHGENSLQYTILPQQEEGAVSIRPKKSKKKGKTAAVLTITIILICGVIATAVLVPLLLTSDLVALPAAFQKFSVSSMHRSHSGNHVVVLAKKPHGWNGSHHTSTTQAPTTANNKTAENAYPTKEAITSTTVPTAKGTTTATTTTTTTKQTDPTTERTTIVIPEVAETTKTATVDVKADESAVRIYNSKYTQVPQRKNYVEVSTTTIASQPHQIIGDGMIVFLDTNLQSTSSPWFHQQWPFSDPSSFLRWSRHNAGDNLFLPVTLAAVFVSICIMVVVIVWLRRKKVSRKLLAGISPDLQTGDKATLLKETAVASEEE